MKGQRRLGVWFCICFGLAYGLALLRMNWGLALFATAGIPLAWGILRLFQSPPPDRITTWILLVAGVFLVYALSPGPFVAMGQLYYQVTGSGEVWNWAWAWLYRPHIELMTGRFGSEPFQESFTEYLIQWQILFPRN